MNLIADAAEYLKDVRGEFASDEITYSPTSGSSSTLSASVGSTLFRVDDEYGVTTRVRATDFIVATDDLGTIPRKGDEITWRGGTYEVLAPNNEPCWRYSDQGHCSIRIHTKLVGKVL